MPDLLLELFSEEIPARMQARAADDLRRLVTDALVERGFLYEGAVAFATPRRLALHVAGLPAKGRDVREEIKGPRVGAPEAALAGFLKKTGLASVDQLTVAEDGKKGQVYLAVVETPGRATLDVLAEILPAVVRAFPWPKSMRWGAASREPGSLRWVRPLQSILCTFGSDTETPEIVPFAVDGIAAGDGTRGHRFLAPGPIAVRHFDDYVAALQGAKVVLDAARRRDIVAHDARDLAFAQGLEVVDDPGLLDEVAGLVEWPVVMLGRFDPDFLALPPEVIRATIRANQKCFVLRGPDGALAPAFLLTANIEATDGGTAVVAGNERVVRARLSDARFFWDGDRAPLPDYADSGLKPLDQRLKKLEDLGIVFHEKLGTQAERVERVAALARALAPVTGADPDKAERAARLAKADLVTEMVGEFPELQGLMGRYYAEAQGEDEAVSAAIAEHYRPVGPSDTVPTAPVSVAVALADKLDTLVGFWAIDETPTGSKDPYALRRAALGVIRLVLENGLRLRLSQPMAALDRKVDLLAFFHDRLKVYLRDRGARHDLIDAVLAAGGGAADDLLTVVRRVEALGRLLDTEDGRNLLAGAKRALNILRIEEKKDGRAVDEAPDPARFVGAEERGLADALDAAGAAAGRAVGAEDYEGAMRALAGLRPAIDAFFDAVTVNDPDPALRENRLRLLGRLRAETRAVADLGAVEG